MTARVVRLGVVSVAPPDDTLEDEAVALVLRVFGDGVVDVRSAEVAEARARHPSAGRDPRPWDSVA